MTALCSDERTEHNGPKVESELYLGSSGKTSRKKVIRRDSREENEAFIGCKR